MNRPPNSPSNPPPGRLRSGMTAAMKLAILENVTAYSFKQLVEYSDLIAAAHEAETLSSGEVERFVNQCRKLLRAAVRNGTL